MNQDEFLIGRGADCDLRLRVANVSRHHCLIRLSPQEVILVDLGSSNGTFNNEQRVRSQATLDHGDEIRIGTCRFQVELGDQPSLNVNPQPGADPFSPTLKLPADAVAKKPLAGPASRPGTARK